MPTTNTLSNLGRTIRQDQPGQFDDIKSDLELGRATKSAYPGSFDDFIDDGEQSSQEISRVLRQPGSGSLPPSPSTLPGGRPGAFGTPRGGGRFDLSPKFSPQAIKAEPLAKIGRPGEAGPGIYDIPREVRERHPTLSAIHDYLPSTLIGKYEERALRKVGRGALTGVDLDPSITRDERMQAGADVLGGTMEAVAPVALPVGAATAPIPLALGLAGGYAGSEAAGWLGEKAGLPPGARALGKEVAGLVTGGLAAKGGVAVARPIIEPNNTIGDLAGALNGPHPGMVNPGREAMAKAWELNQPKSPAIPLGPAEGRPVFERGPDRVVPFGETNDWNPVIPPSRQLGPAPIRLGPVEGVGKPQIAFPPSGTMRAQDLNQPGPEPEFLQVGADWVGHKTIGPTGEAIQPGGETIPSRGETGGAFGETLAVPSRWPEWGQAARDRPGPAELPPLQGPLPQPGGKTIGPRLGAQPAAQETPANSPDWWLTGVKQAEQARPMEPRPVDVSGLPEATPPRLAPQSQIAPTVPLSEADRMAGPQGRIRTLEEPQPPAERPRAQAPQPSQDAVDVTRNLQQVEALRQAGELPKPGEARAAAPAGPQGVRADLAQLGFTTKPTIRENPPAGEIRLGIQEATQTLKGLAEAMKDRRTDPREIPALRAQSEQLTSYLADRAKAKEEFNKKLDEEFGIPGGVAPAKPPGPTVKPPPSSLSSLNSDWKKAIKNFAVSNFQHLQEAGPESWKAARKLGSPRAQANVASNAFAVQMARAAKGTEWEANAGASAEAGAKQPAHQVIFDVLTESRLRGVKEKYQEDLPDSLDASSKREFKQAWEEWLRDAADSIDQVQGSDIKGKIGDWILDDKWEDAKAYLSAFFKGTAERVSSVDLQGKYGRSFEELVRDPFVRAGLDAYKADVEPVFTKAHAQNDGFFSDRLGPLGTYFPLMRASEALRQGPRPGLGGYDTDLLPNNPTNFFATGLVSEKDSGAGRGFQASLEGVKNRLTSSITRNGTAGLMEALLGEGLAVKIESGEIPAMVKIGGQEIPQSMMKAIQVRPRSLVTPAGGGRKKTVPAETWLVPKVLAKELDPIINPKPASTKTYHDPVSGKDITEYDSAMDKLAHSAVGIALWGPADAVYHTSNIIGGLTASTAHISKGKIGRTLETIPGAKKISAIVHLVDQARKFDPFSGEGSKDLARMAELGYLPGRYASSTSSSELSSTLGIPLVGNPLRSKGIGDRSAVFEPFLFGPKGLDVQARVLAYRLAKETTGGRDDSPEFARTMSALIDYNRVTQPSIQRFFKSGAAGMLTAPFVSAGSTMLTSGARWVGMRNPSPLSRESSVGDRAKWWAENQLNAGVLGAVMSWASYHKTLTGKFPWDDPDSRLFEYKIPDEMRKTPAIKAIYGDNPDSAFVSARLWDPVGARGSKALGIKGGIDTLIKGGTMRQAAEVGLKDAINSGSHPFISGPLPAGISGLMSGTHFYVKQARDPKTGKAEWGIGGDLPTRSGLLENVAARGLSAVGAINPISQAITEEAEHALLGGEAVRPENKGNLLLQMGIDYLLAGARTNTRSTEMIQRSLQQENKTVLRREGKEIAVGTR